MSHTLEITSLLGPVAMASMAACGPIPTTPLAESKDSDVAAGSDDDDSDCSHVIPTAGRVEAGSILTNFELFDQDGSFHQLHDHCEDTIVLYVTAAWSSVSRGEIPVLERMWRKGFRVFVLMGEGMSSGAPADEAALKTWQIDGATFPILNDPLFQHSKRYNNGEVKMMSALLIDPGIRLVEADISNLENIAP